MKKIVLSVLALILITSAFAQTSTQTKKTFDKKKLADRAGDHFMLQLTSDHWANMPDSINSHQSGFSRGISAYLMVDKPFVSDPRWSSAFGIGVGNSNIFFQKMDVQVEATSPTLQFTHLDSTQYYKKFKLASSFVEIPVEIRYTEKPEQESKSFKFALGAKVGLMLNTHTKGKSLISSTGSVINNNIEKESKNLYFNTTRLMLTGRIGYGNYSLFGSYQLTSILKQGAGPDLKLFQIGFCLSGL